MPNVPPSDASVQFLICESVREETGGKATLLGYMGGGTILVPRGTIFPVGIQLGMVFVLVDGEGKFRASLEAIGPNGVKLGETAMPDVMKSRGRNHMIMANTR